MKKLLKETWNTNWSGIPNNGMVSFRGYYGIYEAKVSGYMPVKFKLFSNGPKKITVKLNPL